eukprot:3470898-Rhodomonas_salina.2
MGSDERCGGPGVCGLVTVGKEFNPTGIIPSASAPAVICPVLTEVLRLPGFGIGFPFNSNLHLACALTPSSVQRSVPSCKRIR